MLEIWTHTRGGSREAHDVWPVSAHQGPASPVASPVVDIQNVRSQNVLSQQLLDALPAAKTMQGFANLTLGAMALGQSQGAPVADVGGSKGETTNSLTIHGMRTDDQRWTLDGM